MRYHRVQAQTNDSKLKLKHHSTTSRYANSGSVFLPRTSASNAIDRLGEIGGMITHTVNVLGAKLGTPRMGRGSARASQRNAGLSGLSMHSHHNFIFVPSGMLVTIDAAPLLDQPFMKCVAFSIALRLSPAELGLLNQSRSISNSSQE